MNSWCLSDGIASLCVVAALCGVVLNTVAGPASAAFEGVERIEYDAPFGSWVTALPDGKGNTPMLVKDARARVAQMNSIVRYGSSMEEEE